MSKFRQLIGGLVHVRGHSRADWGSSTGRRKRSKLPRPIRLKKGRMRILRGVVPPQQRRPTGADVSRALARYNKVMM